MSAPETPEETTHPVQQVGIELMHFDSLNPRIPTSVDSTSQEAILDWLIEACDVVKLMESIATQGYFQGEPLIITPDCDRADHFVVVEGNRRLAAARLLNDPGLARIRVNGVKLAASLSQDPPSTVPAITYQTRNEILNYLGFRHVTGVRPWEPLEKARFVRLLVDSLSADIEDPDARTRLVAQQIGSNVANINRLLRGLQVYHYAELQGFYNLPGLGPESLAFAVLSTALAVRSINDFVKRESDHTQLDPDSVSELFDWLYRKRPDGKTLIGESRNISDLGTVIGNPAALARLRQGGSLKLALHETTHSLAKLQKEANDAFELIISAQSHLAEVKTEDLSETDRSLAARLANAANDLLASIRTRLIPPEAAPVPGGEGESDS